ncbi:MAG: AraC family transcriptional regulator [Algoriphagus sp.]|jgi:AraC-like DNA-binding protein|uniref:AraC family transcriptional regulator n=1 Tax=Algoriphagus sp. TaxID=1872435 RepID=UPI00271D2785|nr:AraC family transcriptional regulator [Algoriphagus sp.]MDO8965661.1 AraC family transcriptional regulator [Algoriphagus sp.]MDP2042689.1 AraC family transcriptional regulator [Algoriphagus sp.]MDP3200502.1 AraC family transcriptional regulator [Algoriphagus sp.]MDP3470307.1 AraC family transcriptional regulator [Algoriphagus sp.]
MDYYNKVIESVHVRFLKGNNFKIEKPVTVMNYVESENTLILLHHGTLKMGEDQELVNESEVLFIPKGQKTQLTFGSGTKKNELDMEQFGDTKRKYLQSLSFKEIKTTEEDCISLIQFESKVFDVVNFFNSLDIPPFIIRFNDRIATLVEDIIKEIEVNSVGKERSLKAQTEVLVIELLRHILKNRLFTEELSTNSTYFKDPRLIDLFNFIKANIGGDLSNKVLAKVANVSEDYVGQYFKMLTGINPQDYIEYQRMEAAVELLRTSKKSIRDIGKEVGYKDTAYFCRRFKMMYGVPAGKMRRRESLINSQ